MLLLLSGTTAPLPTSPLRNRCGWAPPTAAAAAAATVFTLWLVTSQCCCCCCYCSRRATPLLLLLLLLLLSGRDTPAATAATATPITEAQGSGRFRLEIRSDGCGYDLVCFYICSLFTKIVLWETKMQVYLYNIWYILYLLTRFYKLQFVHENCLIPPQFVVAKDDFEVTEKLFAVGHRHSSLWPKPTTFEWSSQHTCL